MVHVLWGNRLSNYPMSQMFLNQGYNVITYNQRSSGKNTAPYTTFGYLKSYDTVDYVAYVAENVADGNYIGVWGQSMGAATIENAMDDTTFMENVDFVILDSPMGNMEDMVTGRDAISRAKLPFASLFNRINVGFSYSQQRVYPQIENTEIPVLFASSTADNSIPFVVHESLYNVIKGDNKFMFKVDDSNHSDIYFDHPTEYQESIEKFIVDYVD